jgi:hypothetical protein
MKPMPTKRFVDDFETIITTDEKGNEKKTAVYRGVYFEINIDQIGLRNFRRNCFLLLAAIVLLHISTGFVNNQGMYQFYIALPYVGAFFPLLFIVISVLRLPKIKRKYRRDEIGLSFDRMKSTSIILVIFLTIGILGELVFLLFISPGNQNVLEYLYLSFEVPAVAAVYFFIILQRQIQIQTCLE